MRGVAALLALMLAACASAPPASQEPRPLSPVELRRAAEGKIICRNMRESSDCGSVLTLAFNGQSIRMDDTGVTPLEFYLEPEMVAALRAEPWFEPRFGALFPPLAARRAEGGFEYLRQTMRYEATYDPAVRAWCAPARDFTALQNMRIAFTGDTTNAGIGDWPFPDETHAQLGEMMEAFFASPTVRARVSDAQVDAVLAALRGGEAFCQVFYGVIGRNGAVELRGMALAHPASAADAVITELVRAHPAGAVLHLRRW